jgi:hypothetical protein
MSNPEQPTDDDFPVLHEWDAWLRTPPGEAAPEFVERVLAEVLAGPSLPRQILDAYRTPEPSPEFVARTLARVREAERAGWRRVLAAHRTPEASPDFVARTLAALGIERRARRRPWHASVRLRAGAILLAAATAGGLAWHLARDHEPARTPRTLTAEAFSSAPWATAMVQAQALQGRSGLRFVALDGLLSTTLVREPGG